MKRMGLRRGRVAWLLIVALLAASPSSVGAVDGDERWDSRFGAGGGVAGGLSTVYAVATSGTDVYIGGQFDSVGGVAAANIARWNGAAWSALGSGLDGTVYAIAVVGTDVYAGGGFTHAGTLSTPYLARWDGSAWHDVGGGLDYTVFALAASGSSLYVGGSFSRVGGPSGTVANAVARWNGVSWDLLTCPTGDGVGGAVFAIAVAGSEVYVGGNFITAGPTLGVNSGVHATGLAKWDGSNWVEAGGGVGGPGYRVNALAVSGEGLYVGGFFTSVNNGATPCGSVARLSGSTWDTLAGGVTGRYAEVDGIAVGAAGVFLAGSFAAIGGVSASNVARWDGAGWVAMGSGAGDEIYYANAVALGGADAYVGGSFFDAGAKPSYKFAHWGTPTRRTLSVSSTGAQDGWVLESSEASNVGGALDSVATTLRVGDDARDREYRGFVSFNTATLPDGAVLERAQLKVRLQGVSGTNPFSTHKPLVADIRSGRFGSAVALQTADFQAPASRLKAGIFGNAPVGGWHVATLAAAALPFVDPKGTTQFRLRFTRSDNDDLGADYASFFSGNALASARPRLVITYTQW